MTKKKRYIFLGASIRGSSKQDAAIRSDRIKKICQVLDGNDCTYDSESLIDAGLNFDTLSKYAPPKEYFSYISPALIKSISGLRPNGDPEKIKYNIACYRWSTSLIEKADSGIWYLGRSNNGTGYEIAYASQKMKKPCLVFFDMDEISSMISGCTDRLLVVKRWGDDYKAIIKKFIDKSHAGVDRVVRFNTNQRLKKWIDQQENPSEYLRGLIESDMFNDEAGK